MAYLKLYGGVNYSGVGVDEQAKATNELVDGLKAKGLKQDFEWNSTTKVLANMNDSLAGGNSNSAATGLHHYAIYKTIGERDKLYKIFETPDINQKIIEDFMVGDMCDYKYYVYPVCKDSNDHITMASPLISKTVNLRTNEVTIVGLVATDTDDVYKVDPDNVWSFIMDIQDSGQEQKISKTFYQTQNAYSKVSGANIATVTKNIQGLLGKVECGGSAEYLETYDYVNDWLKFARSNCLKVLIDSRGFIIPCDISSSSITYDDTYERAVTVSFGIEQISDLDNISILANAITINPVTSTLLLDSKAKYLQDSVSKYLMAKGG